jgi:hypothetical protein
MKNQRRPNKNSAVLILSCVVFVCLVGKNRLRANTQFLAEIQRFSNNYDY